MKEKSKKLAAITTAAFALPGMLPKTAMAQSAPEDYEVSYRYNKYQEGDGTTNPGTANQSSIARYDIDIHQLAIIAPVSSRFALSLDVASENMSGASPWFITENNDGEAIVNFSGPSITEERNDVSIAANYYLDNARIGVGIANSTENDYVSNSVSLSTGLLFNDKNTTLDFGLSYSDDEVNPRITFLNPTFDDDGNPDTPEVPTLPQDLIPIDQFDGGRVEERQDKESVSFFTGVSQIINKNLLLGGGFSYGRSTGFLSDPYKLVEVAGPFNLLRDSRPDEREQVSVEARARQFLPSIYAALHADYRYYTNTWGVDSHTLSFGWYQNFASWQPSLRVRLYDQSEANFFDNSFEEERADGYYSSDYRLSTYSAVSVKAGLKKKVSFGSLHLSYENYQTGESYLDSDAALSPALVDFDLFSLGFNSHF